MRSFDGGVLFSLFATHSHIPPKRAQRIVVASGIDVGRTVGVHIPDVGRYSA